MCKTPSSCAHAAQDQAGHVPSATTERVAGFADHAQEIVGFATRRSDLIQFRQQADRLEAKAKKLEKQLAELRRLQRDTAANIGENTEAMRQEHTWFVAACRAVLEDPKVKGWLFQFLPTSHGDFETPADLYKVVRNDFVGSDDCRAVEAQIAAHEAEEKAQADKLLGRSK